MPTNKFFFALVLASCSMWSLAQSQAPTGTAAPDSPAPAAAGALNATVKSSVFTVDELIKKENASLLAAGTAKGASLEGSSWTGKRATQTLRIDVLSIYGTMGNIRADLLVDGTVIEGAKVGTKVGPCVIAAIANRCVSLDPAAGVTAKQCMSACWTGAPVMPPINQQVGLPGSPAPPGVPAVMPLPAPLSMLPRP